MFGRSSEVERSIFFLDYFFWFCLIEGVRRGVKIRVLLGVSSDL